MNVIATALIVAASIMSVASAGPTLVVKEYGQRLSDRYTGRDGLPAGRIVGIEVDGKSVRAWGESGAAVFQGGKWKPVAEQGKEGFPFVEAAKLPRGARVLNAARGADRRV